MAFHYRLKQIVKKPYDLAAVFLLFVCLAARIPLFLTGATEEDAYITLRYAANIAHGIGFVYNSGEHVLGTTTPLYTLWLALLLHFHLNALVGGKLLGIACDLLTCFGSYRLGKTIDKPAVGLAAALGVALFPLNLTWAARGMEVGLVAAAVVWSFLFQARGNELAAWACAAILLLLRIDGGVLSIFLLADSLLRQRRIPWKGFALFLLMILPWFTFAAFYFGSLIPTSVPAKLIVYSREIPGRFPQLRPFLADMLFHPFEATMNIGCILAIVQTILGAVRKEALLMQHVRLLASFLWMVLYYAVMALSPVFLFGWYFVPPSPLFYFWGFLGWFALGARIISKRKALLHPAISTAIASLLLAIITVPHAYRSLRQAQQTERKLRMPIGLWLCAHAQPSQTVMLEPIGYIGYFSGLRVLDTVGLVSPQVLPYYAARYPSPLHAIWSHFLPDFVLLRAGEYQTLRIYERTLPPTKRLESHYTLVHVWHDPAHPHTPPAFYLFQKRSALTNVKPS